ncbi:MAG: CHASE3 domain-containing protein [Bacteroidales bacterium]|jgi:methyl-accepting chemotaxis protein|nr:CHASE3 domain-containing protein [Bacteroidales bacterium]
MKRLSIGMKIALSFAIVLILMLVNGAITLLQMDKIERDNRWVLHTRQVLYTISAELNSLHDAETGQRGFIITGLDNYLEPFDQAMKQIPEQLASLKQLTSDNIVQQQNISKVEVLISEKTRELNGTIELRRTEGFEAAQNVVFTDLGKNLMDEIRTVLKEMEDEENRLLDLRSLKSANSWKYAKILIFTLTFIAVLMVVFLVITLSRMITFPLKKLSNMAQSIASGNLGNKIEVVRKDEIGKLQDSFRLMQQDLSNQVREITEGVKVMAYSSTEIITAMTQLSASSAETANSIEETTTTIEEVRQTAESANHKAKKVLMNAKRMSEISEEGNTAVANSIDGMKRIKKQMDFIAKSVEGLIQQSQTIGKITDTVNEVAEQSNLLALNAAIEATKAGEKGKGFFVVANEVKQLADRSRIATSEIKNILRTVQESIISTVVATDEAGKVIEDGLTLTNFSGKTISTLSENVAEAANSSSIISVSSEQQLIGMDQIAVAMESIIIASSQIALGSEQTVNSVKELEKVGRKLEQLMNKYDLE